MQLIAEPLEQLAGPAVKIVEIGGDIDFLRTSFFKHLQVASEHSDGEHAGTEYRIEPVSNRAG